MNCVKKIHSGYNAEEILLTVIILIEIYSGMLRDKLI